MSPTLNRSAARATRDDAIAATLRRLDPADARVDPDRARALLAAITTTDPAATRTAATGTAAPADLPTALATDLRTASPADPPTHSAAPRDVPATPARRTPRRPAATPRRLVLAGGAVAALAGAFVLVPSPAGGDRAFATWTAAPDALTSEEGADAAADCRTALASGAASGLPDVSARLDAAVPAVAEQRGAWTTVLLAGSDGFSALCVTDTTADPSAGAMIGSVGTPTGFTEPGARDLVASDLGVGSVHGEDVSLVAGYAGAEVTGVAYRSAVHGDVAATVGEGRFALWLPGDELWDASTDGVEVVVTYADGTTASAVLTL